MSRWLSCDNYHNTWYYSGFLRDLQNTFSLLCKDRIINLKQGNKLRPSDIGAQYDIYIFEIVFRSLFVCFHHILNREVYCTAVVIWNILLKKLDITCLNFETGK